ncbi:MAG: hypothetical protein ABIJ65_12515 [Chloroflexota bacterium]
MTSWVNAVHPLLTAPLLILPCNITLETKSDGSITIQTAHPEIMLTIGQMNQDIEVVKVGKEAHEKLLRVAQSLQ